MEYNEELVQQVWEKARANSDVPMTQWREDECGAWIGREHYGDTDSQFGWVILNVSAGRPDSIEHLRAFHHRNSYDIANQNAKCHVTADRTDLPSFEHSPQPRNRDI
jgi:hypothetical protein